MSTASIGIWPLGQFSARMGRDYRPGPGRCNAPSAESGGTAGRVSSIAAIAFFEHAVQNPAILGGPEVSQLLAGPAGVAPAAAGYHGYEEAMPRCAPTSSAACSPSP